MSERFSRGSAPSSRSEAASSSARTSRYSRRQSRASLTYRNGSMTMILAGDRRVDPDRRQAGPRSVGQGRGFDRAHLDAVAEPADLEPGRPRAERSGQRDRLRLAGPEHDGGADDGVAV